MIKDFDKVEVIKIPRSENTMVNSLSKLTISKVNEEGRTILIEEFKERSIVEAKQVKQVFEQE